MFNKCVLHHKIFKYILNYYHSFSKKDVKKLTGLHVFIIHLDDKDRQPIDMLLTAYSVTLYLNTILNW